MMENKKWNDRNWGARYTAFHEQVKAARRVLADGGMTGEVSYSAKEDRMGNMRVTVTQGAKAVPMIWAGPFDRDMLAKLGVA